MGLLERINKLQSIAQGALPSTKKFKEMQDELEYKKMQLENTQVCVACCFLSPQQRGVPHVGMHGPVSSRYGCHHVWVACVPGLDSIVTPAHVPVRCLSLMLAGLHLHLVSRGHQMFWHLQSLISSSFLYKFLRIPGSTPFASLAPPPPSGNPSPTVYRCFACHPLGCPAPAPLHINNTHNDFAVSLKPTDDPGASEGGAEHAAH